MSSTEIKQASKIKMTKVTKSPAKSRKEGLNRGMWPWARLAGRKAHEGTGKKAALHAQGGMPESPVKKQVKSDGWAWSPVAGYVTT